MTVRAEFNLFVGTTTKLFLRFQRDLEWSPCNRLLVFFERIKKGSSSVRTLSLPIINQWAELIAVIKISACTEHQYEGKMELPTDLTLCRSGSIKCLDTVQISQQSERQSKRPHGIQIGDS